MDYITVDVDVQDNASPWLAEQALLCPKRMNTALKSLGWWMQKKIKEGIKNGAPGGKAYSPLIPDSRRRLIDQFFGNSGRRGNDGRFLGELVKAVGYEKPGATERYEDQTLLVGWLSKSAVELGSKMELGAQIPITEKMRVPFLAAGIPISRKKRSIVIPARPTFDPLRAVLVPQIPGYLERKMQSYLAGNDRRGKKTSYRKYRVRTS